jgi:uncharacterized DUF497 family protein
LANLEKHGLDFADLGEFDWATRVVFTDDRKDYGETRYTALAIYRGRVHSVTFTRRGKRLRIISFISFRRAGQKEIGRYEKEKVQPR